ncbi:MAG: DMT family transporter [Alphaproteobacteria bacterium]|nr:DMT family transporter [Alphaproteobacteria bacterium]
MDKIVWLIAVILVGIGLPIQGGLINKMSKEISSPIWASIISVCVTVLLYLVYALVTKQPSPQIPIYKTTPITWIAGFFGGMYILISSMAFSRLGAAFTFACLLAGQMFMSVIMDHFKILVPEIKPINIYRIIALIMIFGGVYLLKKY